MNFKNTSQTKWRLFYQDVATEQRNIFTSYHLLKLSLHILAQNSAHNNYTYSKCLFNYVTTKYEIVPGKELDHQDFMFYHLCNIILLLSIVPGVT